MSDCRVISNSTRQRTAAPAKSACHSRGMPFVWGCTILCSSAVSLQTGQMSKQATAAAGMLQGHCLSVQRSIREVGEVGRGACLQAADDREAPDKLGDQAIVDEVGLLHILKDV